MKRLNLTIITVFILVLSLSINTISCSASEPYYTDLVEAGLSTQENMDAYNYFLSSDLVKVDLDEINSYKNVFVSCSCYDYRGTAIGNVTFYCSNDDFLMYKYSANGASVLGVISKNEIAYKYYSFSYRSDDPNPDGTARVVKGSSSEGAWDNAFEVDGVTYYSNSFWSSVCSVGYLTRCDVSVYQVEEELMSALQGSDIKPLYASTVTYDKENAEKLYFKSFNVIPHVGTNLNTSYFTFNYELSDYAKEHKDNLVVYLTSQYSFGIVGNPIAEQYLRSDTWGNIIDLSKDKGYFTVSCSDIKALVDFKNKWQFTDDNIVGRMKTFDIANSFVHKYYPELNIAEITTSFLSFTCQLRTRDSSNKYVSGQWKSFTYDFLSHESNTAGVVPDADVWQANENPSFSVDANGTQTHNSYFYEDTVTNEDNSTTTKYYYTDGDKTTEITYNQYVNNEVPDGMENPWVINVNVDNSNNNGGGSGATASAVIGDININVNSGQGEYVSIDPKDYKMFIDAIKDLLGEFDEKGGLALLIKDTFSVFPDKVWIIVCGGISAMVIVSIVCILRR